MWGGEKINTLKRNPPIVAVVKNKASSALSMQTVPCVSCPRDGFVSRQKLLVLYTIVLMVQSPSPEVSKELLDVALNALGWVITHRVGLTDLRSLFPPR